MHGLMEHCVSEFSGPVSPCERQGAYANMSLHVLGSTASARHDISKSIPPAMTTGSHSSLATQDVVVLSTHVLHELHGVLIPHLDGLVVEGIALSEPLPEASLVLVPAEVGISDFDVSF